MHGIEWRPINWNHSIKANVPPPLVRQQAYYYNIDNQRNYYFVTNDDHTGGIRS